MKHFSVYEVIGIIVPGALVLFLGSFLYKPHLDVIINSEMQIGDFGLFVVLAYAVGQIIQALGNIVEKAWWYLFKGVPSEWLRTGSRQLVSEQQREKLIDKINRVFAFSSPISYDSLEKKQWRSIVRQVHAYVADKGRSTRVDSFNANYGFNRGMSAGFLVISALCEVNHYWGYALISLGLFGVFVIRMSGYGVNYARELVVQFLLD